MKRTDYQSLLARASLYDEAVKKNEQLQVQLHQATLLLQANQGQSVTPANAQPPLKAGGVPTASTTAHQSSQSLIKALDATGQPTEIQQQARTVAEQVAEETGSDVEQIYTAITTGRNGRVLERIVKSQAGERARIGALEAYQAKAAAESKEAVPPAPLAGPQMLEPVDYRDMFAQAVSFVRNRQTGQPFSSIYLTAERVAIICHSIESGLKPKTAAIAAGVTERTWMHWRTLKIKGQEPYVTLFDLIGLAEARLQTIHVGNVQRASMTDWRAAKAFLEMRFAEWGATDNDSKSLTPEQLRGMDPAELAAIAGITPELADVEEIDERDILDITE
jgi:hypothetical protein